jgi:hypothetical protein
MTTAAPSITLLCPRESPRLSYVAGFLTSVTGISFCAAVIQDNSTQLGTVPGIWYSDKPFSGVFGVFSYGLLYEQGIRQFEPEVVKNHDQVLLFPAPEGFDLPFDLFSAVFYMISRYEEYLEFEADRHGRFEAGQSLAFRHRFLEQPVVDQWIELFLAALKNQFPALNLPERKFRFCSTIDIDRPWAYRHKGFIRTTAGILNHLLHANIRETVNRMAVLIGYADDPYDTYRYIRTQEQIHGFHSDYFLLLGNYGKHDSNFALNTSEFRELVRYLAEDSVIGLHPSHKSCTNDNALQKEVRLFSKILGKAPEISRQHFLMVNIPDTYRKLILLGIKHDYSMGFGSHTGFRAGTGNSFPFL